MPCSCFLCAFVYLNLLNEYWVQSLSVEYFVRRFGAKDIVTEMEVGYCTFNWKKVDYICSLYGQRVGVSVTRAMSFPDPKEFSAQMAYRLLYKKLFGLVSSQCKHLMGSILMVYTNNNDACWNLVLIYMQNSLGGCTPWCIEATLFLSMHITCLV